MAFVFVAVSLYFRVTCSFSDSINLGATMEPDVFLGPFRNAKLPTDVVGHFVNSFESKETRTFFYWLGSHTVVLPLVLMLM